MTKRYRQGRLAEILNRGPVSGQGELLRRLRAARIRVSQATLSRDLRDMRVVRGPDGYALPSAASRAASVIEDLERTLRELVRFVAPAGSLVVVKTDAGHAHALGVAIDRSGWQDVVGTVAGDDTLFAATVDSARAGKLAQRIRMAVA